MNKSRLKRFLRLTRAFLNGSSIKYAESKAVVAQEQDLQLTSISDMAIHSPNPIVVDIALQSLAGLHKLEPMPQIPVHLWKRIRTTLRVSDYVSSGRKKYDASSPQYSAAERLTRAFLSGSNLHNKRESFAIAATFVERSPDDIRAIALMAILVREHETYLTMNTLMARLISQPSVNVQQCHQWIYSQVIRSTFSLGIGPFQQHHTDDDYIQMLSYLVTHISADQRPNLQSEAIFYRINRCSKIPANALTVSTIAL
jgi:hypothetical protein